MGSHFKLALCVVVLVAATSNGQELTQQDATQQPRNAEVRMGDGSVIRVVILQENLQVMTKYGLLNVPMRDVRRIRFGVHLRKGMRNEIHTALKTIGSDNYKDREKSVKRLVQMGEPAYTFVLTAAKSKDLEVNRRAKAVLAKIKRKTPQANLRTEVDDFIETVQFPIVGRIVSPDIQAQSQHFGKLTLKLADMRRLYMRGGAAKSQLTVDAGKYGSDSEQWLDTGIEVDRHMTLMVSAMGQIDLWPQGAGQYMADPSGYRTAGKGSSHGAGSLLGRIGRDGKVFLIGSKYEATPTESGRLYLQIVPSPWNNPSSGAYHVTIETAVGVSE